MSVDEISELFLEEYKSDRIRDLIKRSSTAIVDENIGLVEKLSREIAEISSLQIGSNNFLKDDDKAQFSKEAKKLNKISSGLLQGEGLPVENTVLGSNIIYAAPSGLGKTILGLTTALNCFLQGQNVLLISYEISKAQEAELEAINNRQDLTTVGKYFEAAKHVLTNPNLIANMGTNSLVQMAAGGVIGRGVSAATGLGAVTAGAIGEGTMAATNNINEQNAQNGGITRQDILAAGAVGATTAGFGRVLNSGKYDIDNILSGMRQVSQGTTRKDLIKMAATPFKEGLEETAQEGSEQVINNMRDGKPIDDHLGTSAGAGAALGGILGSTGSVSPAVRTIGKATSKVNAALGKVLATDNTDKMLNPEDKLYNPAGVYRKSINDLSKITDENSEEGKVVAAKAANNMQLAFESVQNKVKDMVTQYNTESDPVVKAQIKKEITEFRKNHFEPLTTAYTNFQEFKTQKADE
jgi:hypothetical protein